MTTALYYLGKVTGWLDGQGEDVPAGIREATEKLLDTLREMQVAHNPTPTDEEKLKPKKKYKKRKPMSPEHKAAMLAGRKKFWAEKSQGDVEGAEGNAPAPGDEKNISAGASTMNLSSPEMSETGSFGNLSGGEE